MNDARYSRRSHQIAGLALAVGTALLALPSIVQAQPSRPALRIEAEAERSAKLDQDVQTTGAVTEAESNCERSRRRLWVEGEGWIVRRVVTCR